MEINIVIELLIEEQFESSVIENFTEIFENLDEIKILNIDSYCEQSFNDMKAIIKLIEVAFSVTGDNVKSKISTIIFENIKNIKPFKVLINGEEVQNSIFAISEQVEKSFSENN